MNKKVLIDALEIITELAEGNHLDIDDPYCDEELQKHASYQDDCFGIVYDYISDLKKGVEK